MFETLCHAPTFGRRLPVKLRRSQPAERRVCLCGDVIRFSYQAWKIGVQVVHEKIFTQRRKESKGRKEQLSVLCGSLRLCVKDLVNKRLQIFREALGALPVQRVTSVRIDLER